MSSNWQTLELGELASFKYGKFLPKKDLTNEGYPVFSGYAIVGYLPTYQHEEEQLVIVCRGVGGTGDIKFSPSHCSITNLAIVITNDKSKVDRKFLYWALKYSDTHSLRTGSAQPQIVVSSLERFSVSIPQSIDEQQRIAQILGSLEDKIENNRRMNRTLEAMVQAIFKSWFVDFEPVKAKAAAKAAGATPEKVERAAMAAIAQESYFDDIAPSNRESLAQTVGLFPDTFQDSELGEIPEGWRAGKLSDVVKLIGGGTPKRSEAAYWDGEIPWFSVKDAPADGDVYVFDTDLKITERGLKESSTKLLETGTTIISARGTVGRLALVGQPMAMNQSCYGVVGSNNLPSIYTHFNLRRAVDTLQQNTHGAVFDTITRSTFETVEQTIPAQQIAEKFELLVEPLLSQIRLNGLQSNTLGKLRDTLLPKILSGEIQLSTAERRLV